GSKVAMLGLATAGAAALWPIVAATLLPGVLALVLLAVDRGLGARTLGRARPFGDAYALARVLVLLEAIVTLATTDALVTMSPLGALLVAIALAWIAARHASPWPTYGAIACVAAAAYATPAALRLAIAPQLAAKIVVAVIVVAALAVRGWPRVQRWRTSFLDVPLHLAAVAAPASLARVLWLFAAWLADGAPPDHALLRRVASPIAIAVLVAITHGSRVHAYLAAAASLLVLPATTAFLGLDHGAAVPTALAAALAGGAVVSWLAAAQIARGFARPVAHPLPLFGHLALPSAATHRALWRPPFVAAGLLAALAALGLALAHTTTAWPDASAATAIAYGLLTAYALAHLARTSLAVHAACATIALAAGEVAHLTGARPGTGGLVALGAAYLVASELLRARVVLGWAIGFLLVPVVALVDLAEPATPLAAAVLAIAVVRLAQRAPALPVRPVAALAVTAAAGFAVLWRLAVVDWLDPEALALAALAATAGVAAWAHWWLRTPTKLGAPHVLASAWAAVGVALAMLAASFAAPATAPAAAPIGLALAAIVLALVWFGFAAVRTGDVRFGFAAGATLVAIYLHVRLTPLGADLSAETDLYVAIGAAFALYFAADLLQRARISALATPATHGAIVLPLVACVIALSHEPVASVPHAILAETIGVLYTLGFRRGGSRALGAVALGFYNLGLAVFWICTDRHDALFYTVPVGVSISLLARLYQAHMSRSARRGLRAAGTLLVYFSTYFQVVQFDHGLYPLLLGGFTLAGIALGFWLELRELFILSIGFLVLDVISNLAYYGVHRPVLGWTVLTLAGLLLTASGVVFQLRRAELRKLVSGVRTHLARWD
ncbi:MAG TPA: hypothetical protein VFP84_03530, partial [Kofleriaceae bacterium]|nr:hypothetical protein [Kofleriaceae bacterium]